MFDESSISELWSGADRGRREEADPPGSAPDDARTNDEAEVVKRPTSAWPPSAADLFHRSGHSSGLGALAAVASTVVFLAGCPGTVDGPQQDPDTGSDVDVDTGEPVDAVDVSEDTVEDTGTDDVEDVDDTSETTEPTDTFTCPDARTCDGTCCEEGQTCVDGTCRAPCSGTRCGESNGKCCTGQDICLYDRCIAPGKSCEHTRECDDDQVCNRNLGQCVPKPDVDCTYRPTTQSFDPEVDVAWKGERDTPEPRYDQVITTPTVADVDGSGAPDIVFATYNGSNYDGTSIIRVIDGQTYDPIVHLTDPAKRVSGSGTIAIGDIDTDGRNEFVAPRPGGRGLIAIDDHSTGWSILWETEGFDMTWDSASLVDLNADGDVEVVGNSTVLSGETGDVLCRGSDEVTGDPRNSTAVDLDDDGRQEVVTAEGAFNFEADGSGGYKCPTKYTWSNDGGFPAVGDFGSTDSNTFDPGATDGQPEVAVVSQSSGGTVRLYDGQSGEQIWSSTIPNDDHPHFSEFRCDKNGAGPPTVADFDGDDAVEVATAGACYYAVFETDGTLLWRHPSQDASSNETGSSVFDFQGDGRAEAVYADECFLRVYDGKGNGDGTTDLVFKEPHVSGTVRELPVIADVDGDFSTEVVAISNNTSGAGRRCKSNWDDFPNTGVKDEGVLVLEDRRNRWVPSRQIWNQHSYHVTNVCSGNEPALCPGRTDESGAIPVGQKNNWEVDYLNNFRQNVQGQGVFNAADLVANSVGVDAVRCVEDGLAADLTVEVTNQGARGAPAGTDVLVERSEGGGNWTEVARLQTSRVLLPGQSEVIESEWRVPSNAEETALTLRASADADENVNECNEDNNSVSAEVSPLRDRTSAPELSDLQVNAQSCGSAQVITVQVEITNNGGSALSAGVPVPLEAEGASDTWQIGTPTTQSSLPPGESVRLSETWDVSQDLLGQEFTVRAELDPNDEVNACTDDSQSTRVSCEISG